ncbi:MAG: hypothetical protein PHG96_04780 [Kiritimatiellae bacterium]|nr:hypothetical protein [Kiritimatiellia bacterium]
MYIKKLTEYDILERLEPGKELLSPLVVKRRQERLPGDTADARIDLAFRGGETSYPFVVEVKTQSTPMAVHNAIAQVRSMVRDNEWPLLMVPYLSPERLAELEKEQVSGVDLCGNGIVMVPNRITVMRTGYPNQYPESRPLNNPYRGRSAMVARMLLSRPRWESLKDLLEAIQQAGAKLSLPQASKAVQALREDMMVSKGDGAIVLRDPLRLLDKLGAGWRKPRINGRKSLRLPNGLEFAQVLSSNSLLQWAMTGAYSVKRYAVFAEGGPRRIAVSNLPLAITLLGGIEEPVPNFGDLELIETDEAGYFFENETDEFGVRWASPLQTWLELQAGDARQQDAAKSLRSQILNKAQS